MQIYLIFFSGGSLLPGHTVCRFSLLNIEINGFIIVIAGSGNILTVIMQHAVIICDKLVSNPRTI